MPRRACRTRTHSPSDLRVYRGITRGYRYTSVQCLGCEREREQQRRDARRIAQQESEPLIDEQRAAAWAAFCAQIQSRIAAIRRSEGIDSSRGDAWQTFDQPIPQRAHVRGGRAAA